MATLKAKPLRGGPLYVVIGGPRIVFRPEKTTLPPLKDAEFSMVEICRGFLAVLSRSTDAETISNSVFDSVFKSLDKAWQSQNNRGDKAAIPRIMWFDEIGGLITHIESSASGDLNSSELSFASQDSHPVTFNLSLAASSLSLSPDAESLVITPLRGDHQFVRKENGSALNLFGALKVTLLGPDAGCISGKTDIAEDELGAMGFVISFCALKSKVSDGTGSGWVRDVISISAVPLLAGSSNGKKPINLELKLDFAAPFNEEATYLTPLPGERDEWLLSSFVTDLGRAILMQPTSEDGELPPRFVFSQALVGVDLDGKSPTGVSQNLSLIGSFSIKPQIEKPTLGLIAAENRPFRVLLGSLPSEVAVIDTDKIGMFGVTTARMEFKLGPSIDARLPTDEVPIASEKPALSHHLESNTEVKFHTSWCRILSPNFSSMLLEMDSPDNRTLPLSNISTNDNEAPVMLDHVPQKREVNESLQASDIAGFLPVMPVRGVDSSSLSEYEKFEKLVLSRERAKLTRFSSSTDKPTPLLLNEEIKHEITPLGFQLERNKDGRLLAITFATSPNKLGQSLAQFRIAGKDRKPLLPPLAEAIAGNRFFLVANQMPSVYTDSSGSYGTDFSAEVQIGGWSFNVNLKKPKMDIPILAADEVSQCFMLVKAYPGKSIRQLVEDPKTWAEIGTFVSGTCGIGKALDSKKVEGASKYLVKACEAIYQKAQTEEIYADINDILTNEDWSGVVVLHCGIVLGGLPQQLKGLMGGIDTTKLRAEYFAVESSRLTVRGARQSDRLSALVDYNDSSEPAKPGKRDPKGGNDNHRYGFKVDRLAVRFANGEVQTFFCNAKVYLGSLFDGNGDIYSRERGSKIPFRNSKKIADSNLNIVGRYEKLRTGNVVSEQYTFESKDEYAYCSPDGDKAVIEEIQITRLAFVTESSESTELQDNVHSRLILDGKLKFGQFITKNIFDIEEIDFADLGIKFDFNLLNIKDSINFKFSPNLLRFDFGKKTGKSTSALLSSFPLKFRGFNLFDGILGLPQLGYFGFANMSGGTGNAPDFKFRFGLDFDLDLGSIGDLASKLKDFKMKVLFAFCENDENNKFGFGWAVGFKFEGAGGDGLDIGIQNIIRLKADKYDIQDIDYTDDATKKTITAKAIYALKAQVEVLGKKFPDDDEGLNLFLFVDPSKLGGDGTRESAVGWFAARQPSDVSRKKSKKGGSALDLQMMAIGQRVDPATGFSGKTTRELVKKMGELAGGFADDDKSLPKDPKDRAKEILNRVSNKIKRKELVFDPQRAWSIGLKATFFDRVDIAFGMRDPDLYGMGVGLWKEPQKDPSKSTGEKLFAVDILYRRLTDKLGVYSTEIVPPPSWRQLDFGAIAVTVPAIAFEIFTDGGFTVDLGYPVGNNFERSFGVQVFPFIGSGGIYLRRISGPGAELVPNSIGYLNNGKLVFPNKSEDLSYNPVVEAGVGFRVGLGKEIQKGALRAGLSITVYALLEGAYAVLRVSDNIPTSNTTLPASTFIRIRGVVGVLGELYGYVDFGIVKAGVAVRLFIDTGMDLKTDFATILFIRAGVDVAVTVVIGSICVFGSCVEISISFSFSSVIEYSTTIGSDRNPELYRWANQALDVAALGGLAPKRLVSAVPKFDNWNIDINPKEWRKDGQNDKANIKLVFAPDTTLAADDAGGVVVEAVLMLIMSNERSKEHPLNGADDLGIALAAWTIKEGFSTNQRFQGKPLRSWLLTLPELELLVALASGGKGRLHADRRRLMPNIESIERFFQDNTNATLISHKNLQSALSGLFVPIPPKAKVIRDGFSVQNAFDYVDFGSKLLVDDAYDKKIDEAFEKLIQLEREATSASLLALEKESLAEVMFEEYVSLLIRILTNRIYAEAQRVLLNDKNQEDKQINDRTILVDDLLDLLADRPDDAEHTPASEAFAAAGRLFLHGPRLPLPAQVDAAIPPTISQANLAAHHGLFRLAWQQIPLKGVNGHKGPVIRLTVPKGAIGNLDESNLELGLDPKELNNFTTLIEAFKTTNLDTDMEIGVLYNERLRYFPALAPLAIEANGKSSVLLRFSDDLRKELCQSENKKLAIAHKRISTRSLENNTVSDVPDSNPVIAVQVKLRPVLKPAVGMADSASAYEEVKNAFEIIGMSEVERVLLDIFEDGNNGEAIGSVELYKPNTASFKLLTDANATVVQTNLAAELKQPQDMVFRGLDEPVPSKHVAVISEDKLAFVEIIRRASIVNTGGFYLLCNGIDTPAEAPGEKGRNDLRVLMLIRLKPMIGEASDSVMHWARANGAVDSMDFNKIDSLVDSFSMGLTTTESLVGPGILPILVKRFDPKDNSGVGALRSRFSMLAYDVIVNGKLIIDASTSLAVGPTRSKNDPDEDKLEASFRQNREGDSRFYRLSLPIWKLMDKENPYDIIGAKVTVNGHWRDIYGNDLPFDLTPKLSETFHVPYTDRIIPLNDAPGLVFGWWPSGKLGEISLAIGFDALNRFKNLVTTATGGANIVTYDHIRALLNTLDRDTALLKRLVYQLEDTNLELEISASFWMEKSALKWSPEKKQRLVVLVRNFLDLCNAYAQAIDEQKIDKLIKHPVSILLSLAEEKVKGVKKPAGEKRALSIILTYDRLILDNKDNNFIEVSVSLSIRRMLLIKDKIKLPNEFLYSEIPVPVPFPFRNNDDQPDDDDRPDVFHEFGRTIIDFSESINKTVDVLGSGHPRYLCATGYSSIPGVTEKAIWLIRTDNIPTKTIWEKSTPRFLALPPVSVYLHSFKDLEVRIFDPLSDMETASKTSVHSADADDLARRALDRIDLALSASVVAATVGADGDDRRGENRVAIQKLLDVKDSLARVLGDRLMPLLDKDNGSFRANPYIKAAIKDALSDRFKKRLGAIYEIDTIAIYHHDIESDGQSDSILMKKSFPSAYGSVVRSSDASEEAYKGSFEPFAVRIGSDYSPISGMLVIACDAPTNFGEQLLAPPTEFQITHIQRMERPDSSNSAAGDFGRYRPTAWLKLVTPISYKLPTIRKIPIVLKNYPMAPVIENEGFEPTLIVKDKNFAERLRTACSWTAQTTWKWNPASQDKLKITVAYNPSQGAEREFSIETKAECQSSFEDKVCCRAKTFTEGEIRMAFGFATFVMETESASMYLQTSSDRALQSRALLHITNAALLLKKILEIPTTDFVLSAEPQARADVLSIQELPRAMTVNLEQNETNLPITIKALQPKGTTAEKELIVSRAKPSQSISFSDDKNDWRRRCLEVAGLNILSMRRFETQFELTRNQAVQLEGKTKEYSLVNKEFIYSLPTVYSFEPVTPRLNRDCDEEIFFDNTFQGVNAHIARLIEGLVGEIANDNEILSGIVCDLVVTFEPEIVKELKSDGGKCIKVFPDFPLLSTPRSQAIVTLANVIKDWLAEQQPYGWGSKNPPGNLIFDVKIYERIKNQQILRLQRCVLPLKLITFS